MKFASSILSMIFVAMVQAAPATAPAEPGAVVHVQFSESSPLSAPDAQNKRYRLTVTDAHRYKLAEESFELRMPEGTTEQPCGILVWISPGNRGNPPKDWLTMLDKHHLIWINANKSGNERGMGVRMGLAVDAVHNLKKQYKIDENRVYVSGMSGGAKMASVLGVAYPDVFTGAMPICGVIYYRNITLSSDSTKAWPAAYGRPSPQLFDRARTRSRFVLITGERDMNRESTKDTYDRGFVKDRFAHVSYVEVPGMGHNIPAIDEIEKAIEWLDHPK